MITGIDHSQEILAIDVLTALKSFLEHHRKHYAIVTNIWRPGLRFENVSECDRRSLEGPRKVLCNYKFFSIFGPTKIFYDIFSYFACFHPLLGQPCNYEQAIRQRYLNSLLYGCSCCPGFFQSDWLIIGPDKFILPNGFR